MRERPDLFHLQFVLFGTAAPPGTSWMFPITGRVGWSVKHLEAFLTTETLTVRWIFPFCDLHHLQYLTGIPWIWVGRGEWGRVARGFLTHRNLLLLIEKLILFFQNPFECSKFSVNVQTKHTMYIRACCHEVIFSKTLALPKIAKKAYLRRFGGIKNGTSNARNEKRRPLL